MAAAAAHPLNVEAACGDIGREHERVLALDELLEGKVALVLPLVAVDG